MIGIEAAWGPLLIALRASTLTPQIESKLVVGDLVQAGGRLATLRFGSQVDLILPADVIDALPEVGAPLRAGVTQIGTVRR